MDGEFPYYLCVSSYSTKYQVGIKALVIMVGCRRSGPNVDGPPIHERDIRDIKVDELRKQVQQFQ